MRNHLGGDFFCEDCVIFLNFISDDSEFIIKKKWTNMIFGTATKDSIVNGSLIIIHNWNDLDYISPNLSSEYVLEINHIWILEWNRVIRLENIVVLDWIWWTIDNLNEYNYLWLLQITLFIDISEDCAKCIFWVYWFAKSYFVVIMLIINY